MKGEGSIRLANQLQSATARLQQTLGFHRREARLEAQIIIAHALGVERAWLIAHDRDMLSPVQCNAVETLIARRELGEPVAYILGEKEFYGRLFKVTPDVLIPRPETELLVEAALERLPTDKPARILDLGTGSGCIAITLALERPKADVWALDFSLAALETARVNASRLDASDISFMKSHWFEGFNVRNFDVIVANPPYIACDDPHLACGDLRFEPLDALQSDSQGLADIHTITAGASAHLVHGGWLLFEHGHDQGETCKKLLRQSGWSRVKTWLDISGLPRVSGGQWP